MTWLTQEAAEQEEENVDTECQDEDTSVGTLLRGEFAHLTHTRVSQSLERGSFVRTMNKEAKSSQGTATHDTEREN